MSNTPQHSGKEKFQISVGGHMTVHATTLPFHCSLFIYNVPKLEVDMTAKRLNFETSCFIVALTVVHNLYNVRTGVYYGNAVFSLSSVLVCT